MTSSNPLGARVRALRQRAEMTQVSLAETLDISPSYLNLIEHGRRPLPAHLLIKLASVFDLDLQEFGARHDERIASELQEVFGDAVFENNELSDQEIHEFAGRSPGVARAVLRLYETYRDARESMRTLASRMTADQETPGVEPWRLPSEEVSDFLQRNLNYFPALETGAESLRTHPAIAGADDLYGGLVAYLRDEHSIAVEVVRADTLDRTVRKYEPSRNLLLLSEILAPHSINFQIAHQIGLLTQEEVLDELASDPRLSTEDSRKLCRVALANYFAGALMMPYEEFLDAAQTQRYDIDRLGHRFRASFEQICHRLTTLRRPGNEGIPFHFLRVDNAGNLSKRFSASGIQFARFSGACPRWNLISCFMTPGQIRTQLSQMTDGTTYFCIARTVNRGERGFGTPPAMHAICLGCTIEHAREMVYSEGVDLDNQDAAVPVGVTCRLCERMDCEQRAFPPLQKSLKIDENLRGFSFYSSVKE